MHSQLTYAIAKQHGVELTQSADRARFGAQIKPAPPKLRCATALNGVRGRVTSALTQTTLRTTRGAL